MLFLLVQNYQEPIFKPQQITGTLKTFGNLEIEVLMLPKMLPHSLPIDADAQPILNSTITYIKKRCK